MSGAAVATMVAICGLVWGGFVVLLLRAVGRERARTRGGGR